MYVSYKIIIICNNERRKMESKLYAAISIIIISLMIINIQQNPKIVEVPVEKIIEIEVIKDNPITEQKLKEKEFELKIIQQENEDLIKQNTEYENIIKKLCTIGKFPQNYYLPEKIEESTWNKYKNKMAYQGVWLGTMYAPTVEECLNNKGMTSSGVPVTPGITIATDPKYWKYETKFYIEGIGLTVSQDKGGAIKGKNRFDLCVLSTDISNHYGSFKVKVWVINE